MASSSEPPKTLDSPSVPSVKGLGRGLSEMKTKQEEILKRLEAVSKRLDESKKESDTLKKRVDEQEKKHESLTKVVTDLIGE